MQLTSPSFRHEGKIPQKYTCQGLDINPSLSWVDAPHGVRSFALLFDDPDAQRVVGHTWIHWIVKDIPATVREIAEDSVPGAEIVNSFGRLTYGGPCPPDGRHRYYFRLYALDIEKLPASTPLEFSQKVRKHLLAEAVLMATYEKS